MTIDASGVRVNQGDQNNRSAWLGFYFAGIVRAYVVASKVYGVK